MAHPKTIKELEDAVRWQSDQERAELRHTSERLRYAINQSIQRYMEMVSENGDPHYLVEHSGILPAGEAETEFGTRLPWGKLDIRPVEPGVVRIYGFDVEISPGVIIELDAIGFNQRNDFQNYWTSESAPVAFFGYNRYTLGVVPAPVASYKYTLWYLPEQPMLMGDEDEWDPCVPGGEQWIVWDVMHKIYQRDNYPALVAGVVREREGVWRDILRRISTHTRVGVAHRIDTRGRRLRNAARNLWGGLRG